MRKNDSDFYMLVGRVEEVTDEGNRYVVKVSYEIFTCSTQLQTENRRKYVYAGFPYHPG